MQSICIGNEEIFELGDEAYDFLVSIISEYPFINKIAFLGYDIFIPSDLDEEILTSILKVLYMAIKTYGDRTLLGKSDDMTELWVTRSSEDLNILHSSLIKDSYKMIIKLENLIQVLNELTGYTR